MHSSDIPAEVVRQARSARIRRVYESALAFGHLERAKAVAAESDKAPFYGTLTFTGCIDYTDAAGETPYQTSFMFSIRPKTDGDPFASQAFVLLSGEPTPDARPTLLPGDPGGILVNPRGPQRVIPGDKVKLGATYYPNFAR